MKPTDIRILSAEVRFSVERFRTPLKLSSGAIEGVTYARVALQVVDRQGRTAVGRGGGFLSDLWAFPSARVTHEQKDAALRALTHRLGERATTSEFADPFEHLARLHAALPAELAQANADLGWPEPLPRLAAAMCLAPLDAAVHDAWGLAAARNTYDMYTAQYLNHDLSAYLGEGFAGRYPGSYLADPVSSYAVQHVVGASDRLSRADESTSDPADGLPNSLEGWIERERVYWFKLKVVGADLDWDVARIKQVYEVATATWARLGGDRPVQLEIDANEACPDSAYVVELLNRLRAESPAAYESLAYVEQPTARQLSSYRFTLHEVARHKPVVADESLDDLDQLPLLEPLGWSGVALKTCKGQTAALLTYCWARERGLFIALQDLTNPGLAFVQTTGLARRLHLSVDSFEYNSRQYAPESCADERRGYESLLAVRDGRVQFEGFKGIGLY